MKVPSYTLILCAALPVLAMTQLQCDFEDESSGLDNIAVSWTRQLLLTYYTVYRPEDSGFYVYPDLSCTDNGLSFQLVHNYEQTRQSRIQLYYECTEWNGNVS